jgi:uncharacterized protein YacL (UPF0231 family)
LEQLLVRSKRQRDTEAATINMQLTSWRDGAAANAAIRMAGMEMSMFVERKDVTIANEYSKLSDEELAQKLVEVGQLMLAGPVIEQDEMDLISESPSRQSKSRF